MSIKDIIQSIKLIAKTSYKNKVLDLILEFLQEHLYVYDTFTISESVRFHCLWNNQNLVIEIEMYKNRTFTFDVYFTNFYWNYSVSNNVVNVFYNKGYTIKTTRHYTYDSLDIISDNLLYHKYIDEEHVYKQYIDLVYKYHRKLN